MTDFLRRAAAFLLISACASPAMLGQPMKTVPIADSTFNVYMRSGSNRVEVHRVSVEAFPSKSMTMTRSLRAIEIATGCRIKKGSLRGDQAIVSARVDCTLP